MLRGGVNCLGGLQPFLEDTRCAFPVLVFKLIGCRSVEGADGVGESVPESLRVVIEINAFSLTVLLEPFLALGLGELAIGGQGLLELTPIDFFRIEGIIITSWHTWKGLEKPVEEGVVMLPLVIGDAFFSIMKEDHVVESGAASAATWIVSCTNVTHFKF